MKVKSSVRLSYYIALKYDLMNQVNDVLSGMSYCMQMEYLKTIKKAETYEERVKQKEYAKEQYNKAAAVELFRNSDEEDIEHITNILCSVFFLYFAGADSNGENHTLTEALHRALYNYIGQRWTDDMNESATPPGKPTVDKYDIRLHTEPWSVLPPYLEQLKEDIDQLFNAACDEVLKAQKANEEISPEEESIGTSNLPEEQTNAEHIDLATWAD